MKTYKSEYGVKIFAYVISILTAIICFIPFWLIVIGSFTAESEVIRNGFAFWPKDFPWNPTGWYLKSRKRFSGPMA